MTVQSNSAERRQRTNSAESRARGAVQKMLSLGIVGNGTDGVFGSYDSARIQSVIADINSAETYSGNGMPLPAQ